MAMEPITLFSRNVDPAGVARRLRELAKSVQIDGPDDRWQNAVVTFKERGKAKTLTLTHDPDYYSEPNWSEQMNGMRGYFSRFPESDRTQPVLTLTTSLKFSLGTLFEPDFDAAGDPRLDVVFSIAEFLDGVLFTPSSLRDAQGRILLSAGGEDEEDPEAVWPRVMGEVDVADPMGAQMHEISRPKQAGEDDDEPEAPTAQRVARRALVLTAVTARAILEQDAGDLEAKATYKRLLDWIKQLSIDDEFEPDEWRVVQRPLGKLEQQDQINATWRLEGLVVLAWALNRYEIPPHDELVRLDPLWESLGFMDDAASRRLLENPTLRSRDELRVQRNRLLALHWRLRNFYLNQEILDFAEFARTCWFGPLDVTGLSLVDSDLALQGARLDRAAPEDFSTAHSAALERHRAANWLWEGPACYSEASEAT